LDCRNPFFAEVLGGVFEGASEHQLDTVVHTSGRDEGRLIDLVRGRSVDGLIVHSDPIDPILSLLGDLLIPTVVIADITDGLPSVTVDDVAGGTLLAQHLGSCGHRHVMIKQAPFPSRSAVNRVEAFASTAERLGVKVSWSVEATDGTGRLSADDLRTLTEGRDRATAIMAWSQNVAERTCRSLDAVGISIPGSVAVVGFDGFHQQYQPKFDITTVQAPWAEVGRVALNHLMTLISGESIPLLTTLPVSFYHGSTT
jgi:DNA-binding LacI/PurR family transcriptional regulator